MAFSLEIQNFGKLADATIHIGNLTILAGPNNTGKSQVSKLLYSIFDAMNANHAKIRFGNLINPITSELKNIESLGYRNEDYPLSPLRNCIEDMNEIVDSFSAGNGEYESEFAALDQLYPDIKGLADKTKSQYEILRPPIEMWLKEKNPGGFAEDSLAKIHEKIGELHNTISESDSLSFLTAGIQYKINQNLILNFQTPKIVDLKADMASITQINIEGIGNFQIESEFIHSSIQRTGLLQLQQYSKVIYLESPLYWKLSPALEAVSPRFHHSDRISLSGVPGYFFDLIKALKSRVSGKMDFPELFESLTKVLGGKLILSETGELLFSESERIFSMHLTATGVVNLGILALLIERKVLDKGTFLFIDEPEAHLHPAWQVVMAEALFELARHGINVVIATHSPDILKWIEEWVKAHPADQKFVTMNQFSKNGVVAEGDDFEAKLANIKGELTKPFADLYLGGL